jgi:hypothetical protein
LLFFWRKLNDGGIKSSTTDFTAHTATLATGEPQVGFRSSLGEVGEIRGTRASDFCLSFRSKAGAARTGSSFVDQAAGRAAGASALSNLQVGLGGNRGKNAQRARHAFCLPVLHGFSPGAGSGAWIQENAARSLGEAAPGGRIAAEA